MKDTDFLMWIYNRLCFIYGENTDIDFMQKLLSIIEGMQKQETEEKDTINAKFVRYLLNKYLKQRTEILGYETDRIFTAELPELVNYVLQEYVNSEYSQMIKGDTNEKN